MFLGPMEKRTVRFDITFLSWVEVNTCSKKRKNPAQSCQVSVERPRVVTLEGEVIAPNGNMSSALRSSCCLWLWHGPRKFRRKSGVAALKLVVSVLERVNGTAKLFAQSEGSQQHGFLFLKKEWMEVEENILSQSFAATVATSLQGVKSLSGGRVEFGGAEQLQEMRTKASISRLFTRTPDDAEVVPSP